MDVAGIETPEEYERMTELWSASQVEALTEAIAMVTGAPDEPGRFPASFGKELGMAVQIINDYLDVWRPGEAGKHTGGDLSRTKLTYPMIFALSTGNPRSVEIEHLLAADRRAKYASRMLEILKEIGAREFHFDAIESRHSRTDEQLEGRVTGNQLRLLKSWWRVHILADKHRP